MPARWGAAGGWEAADDEATRDVVDAVAVAASGRRDNDEAGVSAL